MEAIVESEIGVPISKAFEAFEHASVAAASLGQVHYARLRDGKPVAVKVQRPGIRKLIVEDLGALMENRRVSRQPYTVGGAIRISQDVGRVPKEPVA